MCFAEGVLVLDHVEPAEQRPSRQVSAQASATLSFKGNAVVPLGVIVSSAPESQATPTRKADVEYERRKQPARWLSLGWLTGRKASSSTGDSGQEAVASPQHKRMMAVRVEPKTFFVSHCSSDCQHCYQLLLCCTCDVGYLRVCLPAAFKKYIHPSTVMFPDRPMNEHSSSGLELLSCS